MTGVQRGIWAIAVILALLAVAAFGFGVFSTYYAIFTGIDTWALAAWLSFVFSVVFGGMGIIAASLGADA